MRRGWKRGVAEGETYPVAVGAAVDTVLVRMISDTARLAEVEGSSAVIAVLVRGEGRCARHGE